MIEKEKNVDIKLILNNHDFVPYIEKIKVQKILAIDTETTGLDPYKNKIRLIQLAAEGCPVLVIDCFSFLPEGLTLLKEVLESPGLKVFQNAKFDMKFFMALEISLRPVFDTMLAAGLLRSIEEGPRRVGLAELANYYLKETLDKEEQVSDWSHELRSDQIQYAAKDAEILLRLQKVLWKSLLENQLEQVAEIEFQCVSAVAQMEYNGICLDQQKWKMLVDSESRNKEEALQQLYCFSGKPFTQLTLWGEEEAIGHNFDSNSFVLKLLNQNNIPVKATAKADLFPYQDQPLVRGLTEYRKSSKSLSSFLLPIPEMIHPVTKRLHPNYGQISAWSGRMSCYQPNIQQIPRNPEFRECFMAPEGRMLIIADYSQIELRVAAEISQDERMIQAYKDGEDLHQLTASLILNKRKGEVSKMERQSAKAVNFGLIFGMGAHGLQQYAGQSYGVTMSLEQANEFHSRFFDAYKGIKKWHQSLKKYPPKGGCTLTGRKFLYSEYGGLPVYCNTPVQGTAADITKKALGILAEKLEDRDIRVVGVIHDEILLECSEKDTGFASALLKESMEQAANSILSSLPSEVDLIIAKNWAGK